MKLIPLNNYLIIRNKKPQINKTDLLINNNREKIQIGKVIYKSKNLKNIKKGDNIVYNVYSGNSFYLQNKKYTYLKYNDIIFILRR